MSNSRGERASRAPSTASRDAARGPAPLHAVGIWIGAYKPRMLEPDRAKGRRLAAEPPLPPARATWRPATGRSTPPRREAGRDPSEIRRLLNVPAASLGPPEQWVEELTRLALEDGIGTFILMADDASTIRGARDEVAPAVREQVAAARSGGGSRGRAAWTQTVRPGQSEYDRLGVTPTPDDGVRVERRHRLGRVDAPAPPRIRARGDVHQARPTRRPAPDRRPRHVARAS